MEALFLLLPEKSNTLYNSYMVHELPKLKYSYADLEPYIDSQTMEIHYTKHHATYISNLNKALEKYPDLQNKTVEELVKSVETLPDDIKTSVKNNGVGHYNHTLFWSFMSPNGKKSLPKDWPRK